MKFAVPFKVAASAALIPFLFAGHKASADSPTPNYHFIKKIPLTGEGGWDYLTMDSKDRRLYIARGTHVTVLNVDTGAVVGDIPDLAGVHGVAVDHKSNRGFTNSGRSNTVTIFDLKTLKKISDVKVGVGPDAIIFDPASGRVFSFNGHGNSATAINAATGTVDGTIELPGRPEFPVADGKGHIYDNIEDKSEVAAINTKTLKVDNTWSIAPGEGPSGIAMDTKNRRIFSVTDKLMTVMDADTGKIVATPAIGQGPDAAAFDSKFHLAFSPNGQDGTMTVVQQVSPDKYEILATIPTQAGARTMALDEKTHHIFTVSATMLPVDPAANEPRWRRHYAPDSFVVLEYGP